jgi:hypothetical protein
MRGMGFGLGIVALATTLLTPAMAQTKAKQPFTFTDVDRKLYAEMEAMDRLFEQRGLVLHDPAVEKLVRELAAPLTPAGRLELVEWRFRFFVSRWSTRSPCPTGRST